MPETGARTVPSTSLSMALAAAVVVVFLASLALLGRRVASAPFCASPFAEHFPDGSLSPSGALLAGNDSFPPEIFWRDGGGRGFWGCPCATKPCLWMCCGRGEVFHNDSQSGDCGPGDDSLLTRGTVRLSHEGDVVSAVLRERFRLRYDVICYKSKVMLDPTDRMDDFVISTRAELILKNLNDVVPEGQFCVTASAEEDTLIAMQCVVQEPGAFKSVLYPAFMTLSAFFLLMTFLVYLVLPELRNFPGIVLMSHILALLAAYVAIAYVDFGGSTLTQSQCVHAAFIIYFAFLASFFWLNVMCLDIWWTFSGFRPLRGSVKEREHKKFIIYSLYCWGSPLLMLIICLIMDLHPGIPESYEKPGFGEKKCWFRSNVSNLIYFNGPIAILIVCNIVLFILTAIKICQVKRGAKILKKQDSRRHYNEEENNTRRFNLYLKLFLVMGVNWIMEVISFAAGGPDEWWYVTDIANTLQGVLIFIIFVCKRRIWRLLKERFWPSGLANTSSMANSSTRMTAIRRNGSEMSSGRSSLKTPEGQSMKALAAAAPPVRSDDSDAA